MSKKIFLALIVILIAVIAGTFYFQKPLSRQKKEVVKKEIEWVGESYPCQKYSCEDLDDRTTRTQEYFYCLLDCPQAKSYQKIEDGQLVSIAPSGYDTVNQFYLDDLKICFPELKNVLGITPYYDKLVNHLVLVEDGADLLPDMANEEGAFLRHEKSWFEREGKSLAGKVAEVCTNGHELAHVFTTHLNLPHWASEGIAEYAAWKSRGETSVSIECRANGLVGYDQKLISYSDLGQTWDSRIPSSQTQWYNSAACIFDLISQKYGKEKISEILQNFEEYSSKNSTSVFIENGLVPILGEQIKNELKDRFRIE